MAAQAGGGDPAVDRRQRCRSRGGRGLWIGSRFQPRVQARVCCSSGAIPSHTRCSGAFTASR